VCWESVGNILCNSSCNNALLCHTMSPWACRIWEEAFWHVRFRHSCSYWLHTNRLDDMLLGIWHYHEESMVEKTEWSRPLPTLFRKMGYLQNQPNLEPPKGMNESSCSLAMVMKYKVDMPITEQLLVTTEWSHRTRTGRLGFDV